MRVFERIVTFDMDQVFKGRKKGGGFWIISFEKIVLDLKDWFRGEAR